MSIIVGITGASGSVLALNTVDELLRRNVATAVVCSNSARLVWQDELGTTFSDTLVEWQEGAHASPKKRQPNPKGEADVPMNGR